MFRKLTALTICFCLCFEQSGFAQVATPLGIPAYLNGVFSPDKFRPVQLRSLSYDIDKNAFGLLLDKGDTKQLKPVQIEESTQKLLEYFKIGTSLPNSTFWVNLRPDAESQVIDPNLERTDLGKVLLEADLELKKDVSRFTSPDTAEGKQYWNKLYQKAEELFGQEDAEIPTLTRPWIVPGEIIVRETKDSTYIYKATLKVMLEQDYLKDSSQYNFSDPRLKQLNEYSSELIRQLIIPKLTREVNSSKRYAELRQVYYSLILAQWFKQKYSTPESRVSASATSIIGKIDTKDLTGLTSQTAWTKDTYFNAYKRSFQEGEYNRQEEVQTNSGITIRSYFSGGIEFGLENIPSSVSGFFNLMDKYAANPSFQKVTVNEQGAITIATQNNESSEQLLTGPKGGGVDFKKFNEMLNDYVNGKGKSKQKATDFLKEFHKDNPQEFWQRIEGAGYTYQMFQALYSSTDRDSQAQLQSLKNFPNRYESNLRKVRNSYRDDIALFAAMSSMPIIGGVILLYAFFSVPDALLSFPFNLVGFGALAAIALSLYVSVVDIPKYKKADNELKRLEPRQSQNELKRLEPRQSQNEVNLRGVGAGLMLAAIPLNLISVFAPSSAIETLLGLSLSLAGLLLVIRVKKPSEENEKEQQLESESVTFGQKGGGVSIEQLNLILGDYVNGKGKWKQKAASFLNNFYNDNPAEFWKRIQESKYAYEMFKALYFSIHRQAKAQTQYLKQNSPQVYKTNLYRVIEELKYTKERLIKKQQAKYNDIISIGLVSYIFSMIGGIVIMAAAPSYATANLVALSIFGFIPLAMILSILLYIYLPRIPIDIKLSKATNEYKMIERGYNGNRPGLESGGITDETMARVIAGIASGNAAKTLVSATYEQDSQLVREKLDSIKRELDKIKPDNNELWQIFLRQVFDETANKAGYNLDPYAGLLKTVIAQLDISQEQFERDFFARYSHIGNISSRAENRMRAIRTIAPATYKAQLTALEKKYFYQTLKGFSVMFAGLAVISLGAFILPNVAVIGGAGIIGWIGLIMIIAPFPYVFYNIFAKMMAIDLHKQFFNRYSEGGPRGGSESGFVDASVLAGMIKGDKSGNPVFVMLAAATAIFNDEQSTKDYFEQLRNQLSEDQFRQFLKDYLQALEREKLQETVAYKVISGLSQADKEIEDVARTIKTITIQKSDPFLIRATDNIGPLLYLYSGVIAFSAGIVAAVSFLAFLAFPSSLFFLSSTIVSFAIALAFLAYDFATGDDSGPPMKPMGGVLDQKVKDSLRAKRADFEKLAESKDQELVYGVMAKVIYVEDLKIPSYYFQMKDGTDVIVIDTGYAANIQEEGKFHEVWEILAKERGWAGSHTIAAAKQALNAALYTQNGITAYHEYELLRMTAQELEEIIKEDETARIPQHRILEEANKHGATIDIAAVKAYEQRIRDFAKAQKAIKEKKSQTSNTKTEVLENQSPFGKTYSLSETYTVGNGISILIDGKIPFEVKFALLKKQKAGKFGPFARFPDAPPNEYFYERDKPFKTYQETYEDGNGNTWKLQLKSRVAPVLPPYNQRFTERVAILSNWDSYIERLYRIVRVDKNGEEKIIYNQRTKNDVLYEIRQLENGHILLFSDWAIKLIDVRSGETAWAITKSNPGPISSFIFDKNGDIWTSQNIYGKRILVEKYSLKDKDFGKKTWTIDPERDGIPLEKIEKVSPKPGGIDFRALPVVTQPTLPLMNAQALQQLAANSNIKDLDKEWLTIQRQIQGKSIPYERLKEYVAVCYQKQDGKHIDVVLNYVMEILKLEEEQAVSTAPELKEVLTLLG